MRLEEGENWREGFKKGLVNSSVIIMLISEDAIARFKTITEGTEDNLLFEWEAAIKYFNNKEKLIYPVFVDKEDHTHIHKFTNYSKEYPDVKVKDATKTVREIMSELLDIQGMHIAASSNLVDFNAKLYKLLKKFELNT